MHCAHAHANLHGHACEMPSCNKLSGHGSLTITCDWHTSGVVIIVQQILEVNVLGWQENIIFFFSSRAFVFFFCAAVDITTRKNTLCSFVKHQFTSVQ